MVLPGSWSSLNASDPAVRAKLRCAADLRDHRPGPRPLPQTALRAPRGAGAGCPARDLFGRGSARLGPAARLVRGAGRLRKPDAALVPAPAYRTHPADARAGASKSARPGRRAGRRELRVRAGDMARAALVPAARTAP